MPTQTTQQANYHCCVIELSGRGILIKGPSGSGKTSLALGAVDAARREGHAAFLVADDQARLEATAQGLDAFAPQAIAGKAELRGFGIIRVPYKASTRIGLIAALTPDEQLSRMPETVSQSLMGVVVPQIRLPERHEAQSIRILMAWLNNMGPLP